MSLILSAPPVLTDGVNFSLFSQHATSVELLLFQKFSDPAPMQVIALHPVLNKTFHYWHVFVEGVRHGQLYAYRLDGPNDLGQGFRYNQNKVLIDPYSRGVVYGRNWRRDRACDAWDNAGSAMKSLVVDTSIYDWEDAEAPNYHLSDCVIYETHVRGFTRHPSSGVAHPGTFSGLIEKIPYLQELGINCIELMPVHQFDSTESTTTNPETGEKLTNYWGYNSICFFAPHRGYYTADWEKMEYLTGFRDLVKALHKAGIEVILDVVFNHTSETDESGPIICMRGIDNSVYYMLDPNDRSRYLNYTGRGNTVNCNHPAVRRMILECLRFWVAVMRVDGFRFDLASILSRDELGRPMQNPPLLWEIESDPVLHKAKIFAEAWDAAGLYQVGGFPGERWAEWNGRYRDDVRRFVRGDKGMAGAVASRMAGSADLYQHLARAPYQSINFITCHDGFTLNDLVSYNEKHNLANGEGNRDGSGGNLSWNKTAWASGDHRLEFTSFWSYKNLDHPIFVVIDQLSNDFGVSLRYDNSVQMFGHQNKFTIGLNPTFGSTHDNRYLNIRGSRGMQISDSEQYSLNLNFFIQDRFFITERFAVVAGTAVTYARRQNVDNFSSTAADPNNSGTESYWGFTPQVGLLFEITETAQAFFNVSRSFEPPTFGELGNPADAGAGIIQLNAQTATTIEAGTRGQSDRLNWDLTYYFSWLDNELIEYEVIPGLTKTVNAGRTIHQGIEFGLDIDLFQGILVREPSPAQSTRRVANQPEPGVLSFDRIVIRQVGLWNDFRFVNDPSYGNNRLPGIPQFYYRAEVLYEHPCGFYIGPNVEWVPVGYSVDSAGTVFANPYALLGFKIGYRPRRGLSVFFEAKNMTNTIYAATTGVTAKQTAFNQAQFFPGDGTAFYGGVEWDW